MGKWHGNNVNLVLRVAVYKEWNLKNLYGSKKMEMICRTLKIKQLFKS